MLSRTFQFGWIVTSVCLISAYCCPCIAKTKHRFGGSYLVPDRAFVTLHLVNSPLRPLFIFGILFSLSCYIIIHLLSFASLVLLSIGIIIVNFYLCMEVKILLCLRVATFTTQYVQRKYFQL
jgi:hypothetical protein